MELGTFQKQDSVRFVPKTCVQVAMLQNVHKVT